MIKNEKVENTVENPIIKKVDWDKFYIFSIGFLSAILILIIFNNISTIFQNNNQNNFDEQKVTSKIGVINNYLSRYYVEKLDNNKLEEGTYKGMLYGVGDPYTNYFTNEEFKKMQETLSGTYAGIGVMVEVDPKDRLITLTTVFEGAPGAKAGLLPADKIIKVNDEDITLQPVDTVIQKIKGNPGTKLKLTLLRDTDEINVQLTREVVNIPTVNHRVINGDIGYIQILSFDEITADQFSKALTDLKSKNVKYMIIDVRNNPGGILETVINIADTILPKGLIMYTEEKDGTGEQYNSDERNLGMPLAVLVNENSASASEVLAGAIKAHKVGVLVGTKTFGKGVVQKMFPLSDGSALKITISKYFTPDRVCIQGVGIEPDYIVQLPEGLKNKVSLTDLEDTQLQKAIEIVKMK